jgi:TRAP-type C4-dicarboxylate transport system permease small subunit
MSRSSAQSVGMIVGINMKLLSSAVLAWAAWSLWPANWMEDWQFGLIAIIVGYGALIRLLSALKAMVRLYTRDKAIAAFEAQGARPKSAQLASRDALMDAGMLDG